MPHLFGVKEIISVQCNLNIRMVRFYFNKLPAIVFYKIGVEIRFQIN